MDDNNTTAAPDLALYMFHGCVYCHRVMRALDALGVEVELRNIRDHAKHRRALQTARGRTTVPVLRIQGAEGQEDRWMPESADIIRYLAQRFNNGTVPRRGLLQRVLSWF
ncbi:MAG: glutaredoxin [Myxococcota bacterium]